MISINSRDPQPIYEQIAENFRRLIISGVLAPDEKLPSVRELAQSLAINPNTIQRAYRELESLGYSYSVPGRGNFVSDIAQMSQVRKQELLEQLKATVTELETLGVTREELAQYLERSK